MASRNAPSRTAGIAVRSSGWSDIVAGGVSAWPGPTQLAMEAGTAQAKALADLCAGGFKPRPSQPQALLLLRNRAERLADGRRDTLDDLGRQGGASRLPVLAD